MKKIHLEPMVKEKPAYRTADFLLIVSVLIAVLLTVLLVSLPRLVVIDRQIGWENV